MVNCHSVELFVSVYNPDLKACAVTTVLLLLLVHIIKCPHRLLKNPYEISGPKDLCL